MWAKGAILFFASEMITTKKRRHINVETTASLSIRNISIKATYQLSLVM